MTKHRRITGLLAIMLIAAATVITIRSQSPSATNLAARDQISFKLAADADNLSAANFSDRFSGYSTNR